MTVDGNIVNVNSWIECAHYVNGGWDNINYQNFGWQPNYIHRATFLYFLFISLQKNL